MKTDTEIQLDIMEELRCTPLLKSNTLQIAVNKGVVGLTGTVDVYKKKLMILNSVKSVFGVKDVTEKIAIKLPSWAQKKDREITEFLTLSLKWASVLKAHRIKTSVSKGLVTLTGAVEWDIQRREVQQLAENIIGVKGVDNRIKILPKTLAIDPRKLIVSSFHRGVGINSGRVLVARNKRKIILSGKARSHAEKSEAEIIAWQTPGINQVENKITVQTGKWTLY
jgi:osmotically-inducible protein OsmY